MSRLLSTTIALVSASALAVLSVPSVAHADTARHTDQRHDVVKYDGDRTDIARHVANPDITRVVARHTAKRVTIRTHARQVTGSTELLLARLTTPTHRFEAFASLDGASTVIYSLDDLRDIACPRIHAARHPGTNVVTLSVPRRCIDSPRWIRVGAGLFRYGHDLTRGHLDDAFGGPVNADDDQLRMSRRLFRG